MTPAEHVLSLVTVNDDGCWIFTGYTNPEGYGAVTWTENGRVRSRATHRIVYAEHFGEPDPGMQVDHLCHDPKLCAGGPACPHRACCNPAHLKAVTARENTMRSNSLTAREAAVTHCPAGHEYSTENTYLREGRRDCRQCRRARNQAAYHANRDRRLAYYAQWRARRKAAA